MLAKVPSHFRLSPADFVLEDVVKFFSPDDGSGGVVWAPDIEMFECGVVGDAVDVF